MSSHSILRLTQRALLDLSEIRDYSTMQWGEATAERYVDDLEAGLLRLAQNPALPKAIPEFHPAMRFYRVNKHLLVCDVRDHAIVVLAVIHASMDIPSRLAEFEPTLILEVEMLHRQLHEGKR